MTEIPSTGVRRPFMAPIVSHIKTAGEPCWVTATRVGLAVMFLFTGLAHFGRSRTALIRMVPPRMPQPALVVTLTGAAELAGVAALIALLVAMFPANVHATRAGRMLRGKPLTPVAPRLPLQVLWVGLLWWSTWMAPA
jgi:uncharacterized membrane protein